MKVKVAVLFVCFFSEDDMKIRISPSYLSFSLSSGQVENFPQIAITKICILLLFWTLSMSHQIFCAYNQKQTVKTKSYLFSIFNSVLCINEVFHWLVEMNRSQVRLPGQSTHPTRHNCWVSCNILHCSTQRKIQHIAGTAVTPTGRPAQKKQG